MFKISNLAPISIWLINRTTRIYVYNPVLFTHVVFHTTSIKKHASYCNLCIIYFIWSKIPLEHIDFWFIVEMQSRHISGFVQFFSFFRKVNVIQRIWDKHAASRYAFHRIDIWLQAKMYFNKLNICQKCNLITVSQQDL